jgi:hypothetical protein
VIWESPGGQGYLGRAVRSLAEGKNAFLAIPRPHVTDSLARAVKELARREGLAAPEAFRVTAEDAGRFKDLAGVIRAALRLDPGDDGSPLMNDLFLSLAGDGKLSILYLTGLENLPPEAQKTVAAGLARWAEITQNTRPAFELPAGLRVIAAAPPSFPWPASDLFLTSHPFWAALSAWDVEWAFNRLYDENPAERTEQYLFLKALCRALCAEDFALMGAILDRRPMGLEGVLEILRDHPLLDAAGAVGWSGAAPAEDHPDFNHGRAPSMPRAGTEEHLLWSEGLLTARGFSRLHPVLLLGNGLEKTITSAQRELFLPLADRVHSLIRATVESVYGEDAWLKLAPNEEDWRSALSEISPLSFFIQKWVMPKGAFTLACKAVTLNCGFAWRAIRHSTAHNHMASFATLKEAFRCYGVFRTQVYDRIVTNGG